MARSPVHDDWSGSVHIEQIRYMFDQLRLSMPGVIINVVVLSLVMLYVIDTALVLAWSLMTILVVLARMFMRHRFIRETDDTRSAYWVRVFMLGVFFSGLTWGLAGIMLFPGGHAEFQILLIVILIGMAAGSMGSLSVYYPAYLTFVLMTMVPLAGRLLYEGGTVYTVLGLMTCLFMTYLAAFGLSIQRTFQDSIKLRNINLELVEKLTRQKENAEKASLGKSKFLAAASHDLRQPLHALGLFASALAERPMDRDSRKIVDNISASVISLEGLFNALLDISRLDSGALKPNIETFALQGLLDSLSNDYRVEAAEKGLELNIGHYPEILVRSDKALLQRVIRNLLKNAIRYTSEGQVSLMCTIESGKVKIDVIDTGPGIPPFFINEIFEEYVQLNNPERDRRKGLGLGLAIVKRITGLLDLHLDVNSTAGHGSMFTVYVPLGKASELQTLQPESTAVTEVDISGLNLLVIDDEVANLEAMDTLLCGWGCNAVLATSREDALAQLESLDNGIDGILADYRLRGGCTGVEAINAVLGRVGNHVPAMLLTGDTGVDRIRAADSSGFRLLYKPVKPAQLRSFLRHVVQRKKAG